ncbi:hypothetical protein OE88DRAFT_1666506 [Heliocybe sulcata]|uniref:Uncharacterized protein n=1 Tax=Heliocybe sulcata TaxID=5364 RepID=A0A5C3MRY5_9AGAM|nr:hypothetical protein OE88DRAFT_1666506 [Heliocybe sulcata]
MSNELYIEVHDDRVTVNRLSVLIHLSAVWSQDLAQRRASRSSIWLSNARRGTCLPVSERFIVGWTMNTSRVMLMNQHIDVQADGPVDLPARVNGVRERSRCSEGRRLEIEMHNIGRIPQFSWLMNKGPLLSRQEGSRHRGIVLPKSLHTDAGGYPTTVEVNRQNIVHWVS